MNVPQTAVNIAFMVNLLYGVLVYFMNTRRTANQYFLVLSVVTGAWLGCISMALNAVSPASAEFWIRQASGASFLTVAAFNYLRFAITRPESPWWKPVVKYWWLIPICLVAIAFCQTRLFMDGVILPPATGGGPSIAEPKYEPGFAFWSLGFLVFVASMVTAFVRDTRAATGMRRTELQFILFGFASAMITGAVMVIVVPAITGSSQMAPMGVVSIVVLNAIVAYGIATRRIMGVATLLRRLTAYGLLVAYLAVVYTAVFFSSRFLFTTILEIQGPIPHFLAALTLALSLGPSHGRMQRFADRLFLRHGVTNVGQIAQKAGRLLQSITTLDELLSLFSEVVKSSMGTDRVFILLEGQHGIRQASPPPEDEKALTFDPFHPLVQALRQRDEPLVWDAVQRLRLTPQLSRGAAALKELGCVAAMGIRSKAELAGVMLLGPRLSGRIYGVSEQEALQVLCNQIGVAIDNAKLYTEAQNSRIYNDILLNSLVSGVVAANSDGIITVCNREALRIMARPSDQVVGWPAEVLPKPLVGILKQTLARGERQEDQEAALLLPSGEETYVRVGSSIFNSHTGEILGALLVVHDVTNLKALQNQIRRSDRLASIGTLSAGMAHEIKNPLVTIKTFTQLLPEKYEDTDFRETFLTLVGDEVKRIDRIVNQLLAFARPAKPRLTGVHVHDILDRSLRLVEQEFVRKNIAIERDYRVGDDSIMGDADLLSQALVNFLLNSREAMSDGGVLRVCTARAPSARLSLLPAGQPRPNGCVLIRIEDTGCGIKAEDISHIFDPFFTTKTEGTGLGLSVSHGIVQDHGGTVDVQSAVGMGTTISIALPLLEKEDAA